MVGSTIGQYRIVAPLGRGGAGTVYKAIDETLNREVAIKILNPDLADTEVMKRFRAEATTLARLHHPDIATIYELFRSETDLLMVMECVRGAEHSTAEGYMMGTPAYMAPEQVLGQEIDGRADLYSAGVVFYRLLTAALPLTADTAIGMMQRQIADPPAPLSAHRPGLPDWCQPVIDRALAKSPADRFQTAEAFRETVAKATGIVTGADFAKALAAMRGDAKAATPPRLPTERIAIAPGVLQSASSSAIQVAN